MVAEWIRLGLLTSLLYQAMVFSSALTLVTFILVVELEQFSSWDQFFFTFFKGFQTLRLGVRVLALRLGLQLGLGFIFYI